MSDGRTSVGVRVAAVLIPVVLVLGLLEIVVRVTGLSSTNHRMVHEGLVVKGRPGSSYVNNAENRNVVRLNNRGFHDRDWSTRGDAYGILFFGDSMTEGIQVAVDSLFTSRLEDRLRATGLDVDVMNAAVSATGTGHQYLLWKTYIPDSGVRVDRIVLCLFPQNDLKNNHVGIGKGPESYGVYLGPDGTPWVQREEPFAQTIARRVTNYSALANLVYTRLHYLRTGTGADDEIAILGAPGETRISGGGPADEGAPEVARRHEEGADERRHPDPAGSDEADGSVRRHPDLAPAGADSLWADAMRRTLRLIRRWNEEARAAGIAFSVAIIPSTDENNFYENELSRRLVADAEAGRLDVLALTLGGRSPVKTNSFDGESVGHLNYAGHRLVAEELYEWSAPRVLTDAEEGGEGE